MRIEGNEVKTNADAASMILNMFQQMTQEVNEQSDKLSESDLKDARDKLKMAENLMRGGDLKSAKNVLTSLGTMLQQEGLTQMAAAKPEGENGNIMDYLNGKKTVNDIV